MRIVPDSRIEEVLGMLSETGDGVFTIGRLLDELGVSDAEEREYWGGRLYRELTGDEQWFAGGDGETFTARAQFFRGGRFPVVPSEWEIAHGILVVGHRLAPFMSKEVFPTEVALSAEQGAWRPDWRTIHCKLGEILPLHLLLGAEEFFDCLIADQASNREILRSHPGGDVEVRLSVVDMTEYYRRHEFEYGDALAMTVDDYLTGVFSFEYLSGLDRRAAEVAEWSDGFQKALGRVVDSGGDDLEVIEQLSRAFFAGGKALLLPTGASLDEFYCGCTEFEISFARSGISSFVRPGEEEDEEFYAGAEEGEEEADDDAAVPDGFGISSGTLSSLDAILRELGLILTAPEIDSFIFDQLARAKYDFSDFFSRVFGDVELDFADSAQEAVFMNLLEERFEWLGEHYDRAGDAGSAELRREVLAAVEARLEFLREAAAVGFQPRTMPEEPRRRLEEAGRRLNDMLGVLNAPGFEPDEEARAAIEGAIEDRELEQERVLDELRALLRL